MKHGDELLAPTPSAGKMMRTYYDGLRQGVWMYAWWKDGVQYVGTTGKTLKQAIEEINKLEAEHRHT